MHRETRALLTLVVQKHLYSSLGAETNSMVKESHVTDSRPIPDTRSDRGAEAEDLDSLCENKAYPDEDDQTSQEVEHGDDDDLVEGMDPEGFFGPSQKVVKPLTPESLAAFRAAQDRAGVIYISRIPPGMRPAKVRHLMNGHGEVGRVYLQQEGV
jgi:ESF2/ABP1 family protein